MPRKFAKIYMQLISKLVCIMQKYVRLLLLLTVETYSVDGSDGAVDAGGGGTAVGLEGHIEQVIEHHMLEEVQHSVVDNVGEGGGVEVGGSALATEPHFEDTEEDVVNDEEEITLEGIGYYEGLFSTVD